MSIWVVNTSPLVFLGNLGRLELLRHEGREVYIPRAVAEEIAEKPDAAAQSKLLPQLPAVRLDAEEPARARKRGADISYR